MLFFSSEIQDGSWKLNEEESRHIKVLRLHEGAKLTFTNGIGERIEAALDKVDKHCTLTTLSRETIENTNPHLHLFVAPTKNADRIEWLVEKAVEMGIRSITFLVCEHSERVRMKPERIERVAISALKQSLQYSLPQLRFDMKFQDAWKNAEPAKDFFMVGPMDTSFAKVLTEVRGNWRRCRKNQVDRE